LVVNDTAEGAEAITPPSDVAGDQVQIPVVVSKVPFFTQRALSAPLMKRTRFVESTAYAPGAPTPTGAPTTPEAWTFALLPCAALTLSVLAPTAQSETSTRAAIAMLVRMRLCFIYITVFRWQVVPCARIDISATYTPAGSLT
jgi:hypothetical protein